MNEGAGESSGSGPQGAPSAARILLVLAFVGALIAAEALVAVPVIRDESTIHNERWFAGLTAILTLVLFTGILAALRIHTRGLVIGKDNRLSTSKLQALVWTYALIGVLLAILIDNWVGSGTGYQQLIGDNLREEYLVLLGGPFAAAVASKAIVASKVENGDISKTHGGDADVTHRVGEAFSNDSGNTDLVDTQYLLFNLLALTYFLGAFIADPSGGLPDIPTVLVGLTSAGAATYVSNKALERNKPVVRSIVPAKAKQSEPVEVFGSNLLIPKNAPASGFEELNVLFDGVSGTVLTAADGPAKAPEHRGDGNDRFWVKLPQRDPPPANPIKVQVSNFMGVLSEGVDFEVLP